MLWLDSLLTKFKDSRRLKVEWQYQRQMRAKYGLAKKRSSENEDNCGNSSKRMKRVISYFLIDMI